MSAALANAVKRGKRLLRILEDGLLVALVGLLVACSLVQIILREFFSTGLVWGDDLLRHGVLWLSFLGAARAAADNKHIGIDLLPILVRGRAKVALSAFSSLFSCLVCLILCWVSWTFLQGERLGAGTVFASIPYWWVETVFPFSFALMALRFGTHGLSVWTKR
jgi:TRAP-type C4-dicarboxylate transport system permease small subunit